MDENTVKLIVECDISSRSESVISALCRVKYCLPDLGMYIVEVDKSDYPLVRDLAGVKAVHATAKITAQKADTEPQDIVQSDWRKHCSYTGRGVTIAFLDTGISPVADFDPHRRIVAFKDFVDSREKPYDDNAHGTHVAGIAAGNGEASLGKYMGVAPEANVIGVKILDADGVGDTSDFLAGIQWVITNRDKYNIRVANMSVGMSELEYGTPLVMAAEAAWDRGIVVCAAAGNNGPAPSTVTIPGTCKKIITVGSSDDFQAAQIWGSQLVNYSGRGPTRECIVKPDIIAPGTNVISCMPLPEFISERRAALFNIASPGYIKMSGSSMATPLVAGAAALLLEKHPYITPNKVKLMLKNSAANLNYPKNRQGWGALDIAALLNLDPEAANG